ncbi:MAG: hypothetical protein OEZ14_10410 [Acidimicrobiia bacterium]|nr:hypothetical protein [Acidimicrobiia bacterium]MDH5520930.1 hypothetical protein [Acidimicrobiia bacterium]
MLGVIAAAEFTINRPETMMDAAILAVIALTILFVIIRGLQSVTGTFEKRISWYFWASFFALVVIFLYTYRPWEEDPMVEAEIEIPASIQGVEASTESGDNGEHGDGQTTYDTGD